MIFIQTNLDIALYRNAQRARSLPEDDVKKIWKAVQVYKEDYKKTFGTHFYELNNNYNFSKETLEILSKNEKLPIDKQESLPKEFHSYTKEFYKIGNKIFKSPLENPVGIQLVKDIKKIYGKYRSDVILNDNKINV